MGGHLLPSSLKGDPPWTSPVQVHLLPVESSPLFPQANPPGLTGGRAEVTQGPMRWGQGLTQAS